MKIINEGSSVGSLTRMVALCLAIASPGLFNKANAQTGQSPVTQEQPKVKPEEEKKFLVTPNNIQARLDAVKKSLAVLGSLSTSTWGQEYIRTYEETVRVATSQQYLDALLKFQSAGLDPEDLIGNVRPEYLSNPDIFARIEFFKSKISVNMFKMTDWSNRTFDILINQETKLNQIFSDQVWLNFIAELDKQITDKNDDFSIKSIVDLFDNLTIFDDVKRTAVLENILKIHREVTTQRGRKLNISSYVGEITRDLERNIINPTTLESFLGSKEAVEGYIKLMNNGVDHGYIFSPFRATVESTIMVVRRLKDDRFIEIILWLRKSFDRRSPSQFSELSQIPDYVILHRDFKEHYGLLLSREYGHIVKFNPENVNGLVSPNFKKYIPYVDDYRLEEFLKFIVKNKEDAPQFTYLDKIISSDIPLEQKRKAFRSLMDLKDELVSYGKFMDFFIETVTRTGNQDRNYYGFVILDNFFEKEVGKPVKYFIDNLEEYRAFMTENKDVFLTNVLKKYEDRAYAAPLYAMNRLHNESNARRQIEIDKYKDPEILFKILVAGGSDAYLSSFQLGYDGKTVTSDRSSVDFGLVGALNATCKNFYEKFKSVCENGSMNMYTFFTRLNVTGEPVTEKKDFLLFVKYLSQNNILPIFLNDIGDASRQNEVFNMNFFASFGGKLNNKDFGILNDMLESNTSVSLMTQNFLKEMLVSSDANTKGVATALLVRYFVSQGNSRQVPEWMQDLFDKYESLFDVKLDILNEDELWSLAELDKKTVKVHTQISFSYNDATDSKDASHWDGHLSLDNFLKTNGGSLDYDRRGDVESRGKINNISIGRGWRISNDWRNDGYVVIVKPAGNGRFIRHVLVLPEGTVVGKDKKVVQVDREKVCIDFKPQVAHHIGHSYHARKTLNTLEDCQKKEPSVKFVNMRSCGGEQNFTAIFKMGITRMFGTRGVGTMLINDPWVNQFTTRVESGKSITFSNFKTDFKSVDPRYKDYVWPQENAIVQLNYAIATITNPNTNK